METAKKFSRAQLQDALTALDGGACGMVLRAKGIVAGDDGSWIHFDYVPGESQFRPGTPDYTGRLCVIGAHIDEKALRELFKA